MNQTKKNSKQLIQQKITALFASNPSPQEIKKIKKLAMSKNIQLTSYKKKFCKNCFTFFTSTNHQVRIKKPYKMIICNHCGYHSKYKIYQNLEGVSNSTKV